MVIYLDPPPPNYFVCANKETFNPHHILNPSNSVPSGWGSHKSETRVRGVTRDQGSISPRESSPGGKESVVMVISFDLGALMCRG